MNHEAHVQRSPLQTPPLLLSWLCVIACGDDGMVASSSESEGSATVDATTTSTLTGDTETTTVESTGEPDPVYDGEPLPLAEPGEWTWVDFPESRCRLGEPTGIGVRYGSSDDLMIYLQGGGACFNTLTCITNPGSYDADDFDAWRGSWGTRGIFNGGAAANPVGDWNIVYIPYCTGDVFAGDREGVMIDADPAQMHFVGHRNVSAFLQRIVPTFADAPNVLIAGASAGGFGGGFNFIRFAKAFSSSQMTFLDDSAPILGDAYAAPCLQSQWRETWGLTETLPPGCDACTGDDGGGLTNIIGFIANALPEANFGLISSIRDGTIAIFYAFGVDECSGFGIMPGGVFEEGLFAYRAEQLSPNGWGSYLIPSTEHVWTQDSSFYNTEVGGVLLTDWLEDLLGGVAGEVVP